MVDTIVLRIHNLKKYDVLIKTLHLERNKGFKTKTVSVDQNEFDRLKGIGFGLRYTLDVMELNKSGEFLAKTEFSKKYNSSHHYAFVYRVDYSNDFIEFNFSVPKYKFGTNILMDVEHWWDVHYRLYECSTINHNVLYTVNNLIRFIQIFLAKEFINSKIEMHDVELNRIDFCFNQIFPNKEDALKFLNFQKKLHKTYARESNEIYNYETSLMHKNNRTSFKIYHKGSEYSKHDSKEHERINKEKGCQYFKVEKFQAFADRILRYEMTFRSAGLNYIFKHNMFRKQCPIFKIDHNIYLRVDRIKQRNESISKRIAELQSEEARNAFRKFNPYQAISKEDRLTHKYVSNLINSKPKFMLRISEFSTLFNKQTINAKCHTALFSKNLIQLCATRFLEEVKDFQVSELPPELKLGLLIDEYNRTHKVTMQKADLLRFYELWVKYGSFKEAAKASNYARATIYRYKERFNRIGVNEKQFQAGNEDRFVKPNLDLKEYHSFITSSRIMDGVKIFRL
jgi:hypothetical protein